MSISTTANMHIHTYVCLQLRISSQMLVAWMAEQMVICMNEMPPHYWTPTCLKERCRYLIVRFVTCTLELCARVLYAPFFYKQMTRNSTSSHLLTCLRVCSCCCCFQWRHWMSLLWSKCLILCMPNSSVRKLRRQSGNGLSLGMCRYVTVNESRISAVKHLSKAVSWALINCQKLLWTSAM